MSPQAPPMVSVVMPVYCHTGSHGEYLRETLDSVAAQTFRDFELVIVDDCSPMDILPIVDAVSSIPRARILRSTANLGHAESRNAGVRAAECELIAFLDHDDTWMPEKLERQVALMQANRDAAMTFCRVDVFGPGADRFPIDQKSIPERPDFAWLASHRNVVISATAAMIRKQAMLDIGLFDTRYSTCDDYDAWLKVLQRAPIVFQPETLARYRLHRYNVNWSIDRANDNKLLTALIWSHWLRAPLAERIRLAPALSRKILGRACFIARGLMKPALK